MKQRIKNWLLRHLFKAVTLEELVRFNENSGVMFLNGVKLSEGEIKSLQQEVKMLKEFRIWKVMNNSLAEQAQQKMFTKSQNWEDMVSGKMMLYCTDLQNKIIETVEKARW